jgi:large subunit ribosomal protein L1
MELNKDEIAKFIAENKGKRKFKQSVELAINFKGIDFSKQDNRLNLEVILPHGKGKVNRIAIFASDKNLVESARKLGLEIIEGDSLGSIANDQARLRGLLNYELMAQQSLMPNIARSLGQFLGPRNRMPKPLIGNVNLESMANDIGKRVSLRSKGKFLPTIHCVVGNEEFDANKLCDNINEIINSIVKKVGQNHIRSVYLKLSMSKPLKLA